MNKIILLRLLPRNPLPISPSHHLHHLHHLLLITLVQILLGSTRGMNPLVSCHLSYSTEASEGLNCATAIFQDWTVLLFCSVVTASHRQL